MLHALCNALHSTLSAKHVGYLVVCRVSHGRLEGSHSTMSTTAIVAIATIGSHAAKLRLVALYRSKRDAIQITHQIFVFTLQNNVAACTFLVLIIPYLRRWRSGNCLCACCLCDVMPGHGGLPRAPVSQRNAHLPFRMIPDKGLLF